MVGGKPEYRRSMHATVHQDFYNGGYSRNYFSGKGSTFILTLLFLLSYQKAFEQDTM